MTDIKEYKNALLQEADKLHKRLELSRTVSADWYEPGMMEYLDKSDGIWNEISSSLLLRFEARGTRYDGRTERLERVNIGDPIFVQRDPGNPYNSNNFRLLTEKGWDVGNMPAELCNAIAPLYDAGALIFTHTCVSYVEPITKRSRYARQAVLFVELICRIVDDKN